ncbi:MAG: ribosome small subunit-dependent GTPase A [Treponema sp.]|jgi:ribosome biogenesis GTPase|nr:ribosome small subunit-dependent GTPase A [Treponema sp.]
MFNLKDYGYTGPGYGADALRHGGLVPGRVIEARRELYKLICGHGEVPAELSGAFYHAAKLREDFPVVGDFVLIKYNALGNSLISELLPRRTKFSRVDLLGHAEGYAKNVQEQVVAANFDSVFILCSLNYDFSPHRIARYITAALRSGGFPVVLLTKADLVEDFAGQTAAVRKIAGESPVIPVSSITGFGLGELAPFLAPGKTVVFLGSSGVGKSSLLNALAGEAVMDVKAIRDSDSKGRHTTSHRQMYRLASGALVIDTPGMRELGLWDAGEGVSLAFAGLEALLSRCRFANCSHQSEPGCAVLAALAEGSLLPELWKLYQAQKREAARVEQKAAYLKEKKTRHKTIARQIREQYAARDRLGRGHGDE